MSLAALASGLPAGLLRAAASEKQIAGFHPEWVPPVGTLKAWLKQLHDFGPIRATGTPQARAFEEWLAQQMARLGYSIERDRYRLTSWECSVDRDCAVSVVEDGGKKRTLEVVAYYPFGGSTRGKEPVSGRVFYGGSGEDAAKAFAESADAAKLAESIVVLDMPIGFASRDRTKLYPLGFGESAQRTDSAPPPSAAGARGMMKLFESKCKGLILCFTDVSNEAARHNYLPFSEPHGAIPGLWVGAAGSKYLQSVSGKATLTMRCDAKLTPDARADSIVATLPGKSDEVVFLTSHTDGPNECNENGPLGLLALATYATKVPASERARTLVVSLPTGHYGAGAVADPVTGSGMRAGTSGVMTKRPELVKRMVGQIALEQMGAMEWAEVDGKWRATGKVAQEFWIPTPTVAAPANQMFMATTRGEDPRYSRVGLVESGYAPGEGGAPRSRGIPGIGLMGSPYYFFRADPKGVLDKLDPRVMHNQVSFATKLMVLMNRLSVKQLSGKAPITDQDLFGA